MNRVKHNITPIYDANSKILILGSFPSQKSREEGFYYAHPRNRFWKTISRICGSEFPKTIKEKREMLMKNGIALWDVIDSCVIDGSSDSSIESVKPNDLGIILDNSNVRIIFCNGRKSEELYKKYFSRVKNIPYEMLPSTSPANASVSDDDIFRIWNEKLSSYIKHCYADNC